MFWLLPSPRTASRPFFEKKKKSSPQVTTAHIVPLEPEGLSGTFNPFAGGCCHGFILLITLDIDMRVDVPSLAQGNEWPWE